MKKTYNTKIIKEIGARIKHLRQEKELDVADLAEIAGISAPSIDSIEKGNDIYFSYLVQIALALEVHPKDLLNIEVVIKRPNKLTPKREDKQHLKKRLDKMIVGEFFQTPKFVRDVSVYLQDNYKIKASSSTLAVMLGRYVDDGYLKFEVVGRQKRYSKKK